jgi:hypothetical protein
VALAALLAATAYVAASARHPGFTPNTDKDNVMIMVAKDLNPGLYASDYVFTDDSLYRFYIPWYRWLMGRLWILTGSYETGLVWIVPIMVTIYVLGMILLLVRLSGWVWVAVGLALVSTSYREAMGSEMWGVATSDGMLARTIYAAFSPYLFWLMFRWLSSPSLRLTFVTGIVLGVAANLHPTSGLFMVGFVSVLFFLTYYGRLPDNWHHLATLLGAAAIASLPIVLSVLGRSDQPVSSEVSFEVFSQIVIERIKIPFRPHDFELDLIGVILARPLLDYLVWLYLALGIGLAGVFIVRRRWLVERAHILWLVGGLVVCLYAFMVALFNEPFFFVVAGVYVIYRFYKGSIEVMDWWILGLLALVVLFSYVGYYVVAWIWQTFEAWSLTSLLIEQSRAARYVYLPLFFLSARAARAWIPEFQTRIDLQRGLVNWRDVGRGGPSARHLDRVDLALAFGLLYAGGAGISRQLFNTIPGILIGFLGLAVTVALMAVVFHTWRQSVSKVWQIAVILVGLGLIFFTPAGTWLGKYSPLPVPVLGSVNRSEETNDGQELFAWARSNTSADALFYWCGLDDRAALHFRAKGQRSITHNWKDLGLAIYDRAHLVEFYERYHRLQEACQTPETAVTMARELKADYILAPAGLPDPGLPLCFSGGRYSVYAVNGTCQVK